MVLRNLSESSFSPYGHLICDQEGLDDDFQVIIDERDAPGWRIAVSRKTREPITELGRHPNTRESFEPLSGVSAILVAATDDPENIEAFLLDQPVCLLKNIWHATVALSEKSTIKITENAVVESYAYKLASPLHIGIISY